MRPLLPSSEYHPGGAHDLVSAHQALAIAWLEAARAFGVELGQPLAKLDPAQASIKIDRIAADRLRYIRDRCQTLFERTQIKTGAADDDRQPPRTRGGGDLVERQRAPMCGGATLGGVEEPVQPMRHPALCSRVGTRR
jgi:hypothetical protein